MKNRILFFLALSLCIVSLKAQTYYYVDGELGSDDFDGTSWEAAWKTIQFAFNSATPGSITYIKGGVYNEQLSLDVSGNTGDPIEFRGFGSDTVIIDGTGLSLVEMIYIQDKSNVILNNLTIQNNVQADAVGIYVECQAGGTVENLTFKNIRIKNISWTSNSSQIPTENDNSQPFIVYGRGTTAGNAIKNIIVDSCEIYNNISGFSESLTFDGNIDGFTISNCKIHDNTNIGIDLAGNYGECTVPSLDQARNGNVYDNVCYNDVSAYATSAGIYVDGGKDITIERNTCYSNGWGIEVGCEQNGSTSGIIVRDNIIYNNQEAGIAVGGYDIGTTGQVLTSYFTNNTLVKNNYSNDGFGEIYITKASNCVFKNNIFYTNAQNILLTRENISPQTGNLFNYNCWFTPNNNTNAIVVNWGGTVITTFSGYKSSSGYETNSKYADPLIADTSTVDPDYSVMAGSPCIDAGDPSFVIGVEETDFAGDNRIYNSVIEMGAYEYSGPYSIPDMISNETFSIYPNPACDYVNIISEQRISKIILTDNLGQKVAEKEINAGQYQLNLSEIKPGIYFLTVIYDNRMATTLLQKIL